MCRACAARALLAPSARLRVQGVRWHALHCGKLVLDVLYLVDSMRLSCTALWCPCARLRLGCALRARCACMCVCGVRLGYACVRSRPNGPWVAAGPLMCRVLIVSRTFL